VTKRALVFAGLAASVDELARLCEVQQSDNLLAHARHDGGQVEDDGAAVRREEQVRLERREGLLSQQH
jgi:hypothetical protein